MATNVWTMYEGQTGAALRGQLKDASGAVNLDQFDSVAVIVSRSASSAPLVNAAPTLDADQDTETLSGGVSVSGKGWLTFTTEATAAALDVRRQGYLLSFKCMDGTTPHYFPQNRRSEQTYGKLVVQEPLA